MDPQMAAMLGQMGGGGGGGGDPMAMLAGFWDSPMVAQFAFQPRPAVEGEEGLGEGMTDGSVEVGDGKAGPPPAHVDALK